MDANEKMRESIRHTNIALTNVNDVLIENEWNNQWRDRVRKAHTMLLDLREVLEEFE